MTRSDLMNAIKSALEPQQRRGKGGPNIGGLSLNRANGKEAYGAMVAHLLYRNNGTIWWDIEPHLLDINNEYVLDRTGNRIKNPVGSLVFKTIYEYMAAMYHNALNAPDWVLRDAVDESANEFSSGVNVFSKWAMENFGVVLFRCLTPGFGNKVTALTIHGDYIQPGTNKKAFDVQLERDKAAVTGQIDSSYKKMARLEGEVIARNQITGTAIKITSQPLVTPKKGRLVQ
jgi:hypothetical protein